MNIVIVGVGKIGATLVEYFTKERHNLTVIDIDSKAVEGVVNKFDALGIVGGGVERNVLLEAGVDKTDFFVACTPRDELNVLSCVLAKRLGAGHTIARVRDPEYFKEMETIRTDLGLDMVFNPEYRTAMEIAQILKFPSATNIESFGGGKALLMEFNIEKGNPLIGKQLMDISKEGMAKVLFAMVQRDGDIVIPRGDHVVKENDIIHIIGSEADIISFCKKMRIFKPKAKSVFIIGGGKIAYYLVKEFLPSTVNVKILDNDLKRCRDLSRDLPLATILLGDGTDQEVLDEEHLKDCDACLTLTGIDEENVIISMYASQQKVDKVITKVNRASVLKMVKQLGLNTAVSPHIVIANHLLRFVRAHQVETDEGLNALYKISDKAEALEFTVQKSFTDKLTPLKDLKMRRNAIVGGIVRNEKFILPTGDSILVPGDKVVIITTETQINELSQVIRK